MNDIKKYRILSIEAEKLLHSNTIGGFSIFTDKKPKLYLFSGMLDACLESPVLHDLWKKSRMTGRVYFNENGNDYTTAIINVKFDHACHDFVMIDGIYSRYGHKPGEGFYDSAETITDQNGNVRLMSIRLHKPLLDQPISNEILAPYFVYDPEKNFYTRKKDGNTPVHFDVVYDVEEIRRKLYEDGFILDGRRYVRYKRSAGSSRAGHCLFIAEPLWRGMMKWSLCGLDTEKSKNNDLASYEAYISLPLSSIIGALHLPRNSILFIKDIKSIFKTNAVSVESGETGQLFSCEKEVEVQNILWDGEALLDKSVFEESGYKSKGMMLLRNRFFKTCAFNTNLTKFFSDNNITEVSQLCGYTEAKSISELKIIVTESSLKYLKLADKKLSFEEKISAWLKNIDEDFGIVKTDKPTGFFDGRIVRTSYQLLNTLGLSNTEVGDLLKDTLDYYKKVRSHPEYMRNYINYTLSDTDIDINGDTPLFSVRQKVIMDLLALNDDFTKTVMYREFKKNILSSFSEKIRSGQVLVSGTNATIFGNGIELLYASIGKFREGDKAICLGGEEKIYCKHFQNHTELLGCRSPHVTMGNLYYCQNSAEPIIDEYFNLTGEIVCVNAINSNIQQRLNGCDYDSDAMLLTDNKIIVCAAKRNRKNFAVPVCSIASTPKAYESTSADRARLDHEIAQNKIGEIINLSQLLNTLFWHTNKNYPEQAEENQELYRNICILAVLSGMEIDKAKRNYDVMTQSVLSQIKRRYPLKKTPLFFNFIMEKRKKEEDKMAYDTTMDYLFTTTKDFTRKLSQQKNKATPLVSFIDLAKEKSADSSIFLGMSNDSKDKEKIKRFARNTRLEIENLRIEMSHSYGDEKYQYMQGISENYQALIDYVSKKLKNYHILRSILLDIDQNYSSADKDDKKFLWTLFEALCLEKNRLLYAAISKVSVSEMYDLVPDDSGSIEIYGIKHSKNAVKNVKF